MNATLLLLALPVLALTGCGHGLKDRTAPCKRPMELAAFTEDAKDACGPMQWINGGEDEAVDALARLVGN